MTGLFNGAGEPIPETVKGREIWRVTRPPRPGFRPETWLLIEREDGAYQFACDVRGRREERGPAVTLQEAGRVAQEYVAGLVPPAEARLQGRLLQGFATALAAIHAFASQPDGDEEAAAAAGAEGEPQ